MMFWEDGNEDDGFEHLEPTRISALTGGKIIKLSESCRYLLLMPMLA